MGNLKNYMKITWITFMIGTLAIAGIPPFSGFFSKDLILEKAFSHHGIGHILWALGFAGAFTTAFYMFRLVFLTFYGKERIDHHVKEHLHESPLSITFPLMVLAIGAALAGLLQVPHVLGGGVHILEDFFKPIFSQGERIVQGWGITKEPHHMTESMEITLMVLSVGIALTGILLARSFFIGRNMVPPADEGFQGFPKMVYAKYYIDEIYQSYIITPLIEISEGLATWDKKYIDGIVEGTGKLFLTLSDIFRKFQTGIVGDYALFIVLGTIFVLFFAFFKGA